MLYSRRSNDLSMIDRRRLAGRTGAGHRQACAERSFKMALEKLFRCELVAKDVHVLGGRLGRYRC